jgi:hypothetical protein
MTDEDINYLLQSIQYVAENFGDLAKDYTYNTKKNIYFCNTHNDEFETNFIEEIYETPFS